MRQPASSPSSPSPSGVRYATLALRRKDVGPLPPESEKPKDKADGCGCGADCVCAGGSTSPCPCGDDCAAHGCCPGCPCGCCDEESAEPSAPDQSAAGSPAPRTKAAGPATYTFLLSDGDFDRYDDRLSVKGWQLEAFNANPVIFYNHDSGIGFLSDRKTLPIGKGRAYVAGNALMLDVQFDQDDPFAAAVEKKVAKGILNAVSVGYRMLEGQFRENERHGYDCDAQELLEASVVTIPGNARALRVRALTPESLKAFEAQATEVLSALATRAAEVSAELERIRELSAGPRPTLAPATGAPQAVPVLDAKAIAEALLTNPELFAVLKEHAR